MESSAGRKENEVNISENGLACHSKAKHMVSVFIHA